MGQSNESLLLIITITTLFTGCCGTVSNFSQTNWSKAQWHCRKEGKILTNLLAHPLINKEFVWTGYYTRFSKWIKLIGCFEETVLNTFTRKSCEMDFPTAGLCQEVCLTSNYSLFGLQFNKCVCLEQIPRQGSRGSNDCPSSCSGNYTTETNITFKHDCGGQKTFSLFKSGSEMENSAFTTFMCLSIQCALYSKTFKDFECSIPNAQICNETRYESFFDWQSSSANCKAKCNSYLLGDVDLTDPEKACNSIRRDVSGPSWLGIAKEKYISIDGVKDDIVQIKGIPPKTYPLRCLKCNSDHCIFADCNEFNYFECMEMPETTSKTQTGSTTSTTPHGTVSTSTTPTGTTTITTLHGTIYTNHSSNTIMEAIEGSTKSTDKKKDSMMKSQNDKTTVIMIIVPVTVILILGLIGLLLIIFWRRRQSKKTVVTNTVQHEPNSPKHSEKGNTNHSSQKNYFVLDKTEIYSVVNSKKHANNKSCRSPNNECYDDDYDHLGENLREEEEEKDTYHHAFFPSNDKESDYGIQHISVECQMENPYSHTNTGAYHIALADNEYNKSSINA